MGDFRDSVNGAGTLGVVGNTLPPTLGNIEVFGDADVFSTNLIAGLTYTMEMRGAATGDGTLADPFLFLVNGADVVLTQDDNSGTGLNSRIVYTPNFTGLHYLRAEAFADAYTGTYQVAVQPGIGTAGADIVVGTSSADAVNGAGGNDNIRGAGGNDRLFGAGGVDTLRGEAGNDVLRGGLQADILIGGLNNDTFQFNSVGESTPAASDRIRAGDGAIAFQGAGVAAGDRIDLTFIDANVNAGGNQAFIFGGNGIGRISLVNSGADTVVRGNVDGDAAFEFSFRIEDVVAANAYSSTDFIL